MQVSIQVGTYIPSPIHDPLVNIVQHREAGMQVLEKKEGGRGERGEEERRGGGGREGRGEERWREGGGEGRREEGRGKKDKDGMDTSHQIFSAGSWKCCT